MQSVLDSIVEAATGRPSDTGMQHTQTHKQRHDSNLCFYLLGGGWGATQIDHRIYYFHIVLSSSSSILLLCIYLLLLRSGRRTCVSLCGNRSFSLFLCSRSISFLRVYIFCAQILCVCCSVRALRVAPDRVSLGPAAASSVKLRHFVRLFGVISPFFQKSVATLRPFVVFARVFSCFCGQPALNRHHSAAVWLLIFLRLLGLFWFCCPPGCLWVPRWLPEGAPPTFGSQKLLMVLFSYCKRNKPGRPPKWSQKGILVLLAAPGSLRCSGLVWVVVGCIGALTPPGKNQQLFVHGSGI